MIYRKLGRTGISVSAIALGCEGFSGKTEDEAEKMVFYAMKNVINFIDIYSSDPDLRSALGHAFAHCQEHFVIQGHIGSIWKNGQYERSRNIPAAKASFEELLRRLKTDCIEIGMIHYSDQVEDFHTIFDGEFIQLALQLKREGKIQHIGMSSHNPVIAQMAVKTGMIDVLLFAVNPCYDMQPPDEDVEMLWADERYAAGLHNFNREREALYELCAREGVAIDAMKVYGGGDLLRTELSPFGKAFTPVQAIQYALTRPAVTSVMIGAKTISEVQAALAWCEASEAEKDYAAVLAGLERFTWHGHCMYCGHCAPCPQGINIADVNKFLNLAIAQGNVPETVREHYKLLSRHASDCIQCGVCEKRCPFHVEIREKMKQAAAVFGDR